MSKRACLLGVGLVVMAFVVTDRLLTALPGVTAANVRRIQEGRLTMGQVEALLGGPGKFVGLDNEWGKNHRMYKWSSGRAVALVWVGRDDLTLAASFKWTGQTSLS